MVQADYSSAQTYFLFALMNPAPAELLHLLAYAALQPIGYPTSIQILQHPDTPGWEDATKAPLQIFQEARLLNISSTSQKKRRQLCRRRNTFADRPTLFPKNTLPRLT
jgi:hypothetical protein